NPVTRVPEDTIFVTDVGDNSIKAFTVFDHFGTGLNFFFEGNLIGTIQGGSTKLKRPEGIALGVASDALYVTNTTTNTLSMFTDLGAITGGGTFNIPPTLIMSGRATRLDFPVGVALPQFTPTPTPGG
ncbi:MAG TPA: hypothetical protein VE243_08075, partial [Candidatus Acidoferrum sp.]|nr:hypothetical protein [Candidatus Acidoferrum sp.]